MGRRIGAIGLGLAFTIIAVALLTGCPDMLLRSIIEQRVASARKKSWQDAEVMEISAGGSSPRVAIDEAGNALVVWIDSSWIKANRYKTGDDGWQPSYSFGMADAYTPQIAMDSVGKAVAVWVNTSDTAVYARRFANESWGSSNTKISGTFILCGSPQVAMGQNDNGFAVFHESTTGYIVRNQLSAGTWGTATDIGGGSAAGGTLSDPNIAVSANGEAFSIMATWSAGNKHADVYQYTGASWVGPDPIYTAASFVVERPDIDMSSSGDAAAAWRITSNNQIAAALYVKMSYAWQTSSIIYTGGLAVGGGPYVDINSSGSGFVIWEAGGQIRVCACDAHYGTFGAEEMIGSGTDPYIAVDDNGDAVAVWVGSGIIRTKRYSSGQGWGSEQALSTGGGASSPHLAVNGNGVAVAVWVQNADIYAARYE